MVAKPHRILLLLFFPFLLLGMGCSFPGSRKNIVIGVSQCMLGDAWRQAMIREMRIEASNYDDVEIVIRDANNDNETQIRQIRELIRRKVDVLVISPYQSAPITAVAEEAFLAGIPTIITDRKVNTDQFTSFVGANNYEIGKAAGTYAREHLPEGTILLEVWGLVNTSPAQERHQGFADALADRKDLLYRQVDGQWLYDTARVQLQRMERPEEIGFVYSHNDMMAIAAREYFVNLDSVRGNSLPVIGVDAVPGAGLEAVQDGRINASFMYPTGGEQVVQAAMRIVNGEKVDKFIPLRTSLVNSESARNLLFQAEQLQNYQRRIEAQRSRIDGLSGRFYFLRDSILVILFLMTGLIALSVYVFYMNRKLRLTNDRLLETNRKEEEQRKKLIALNAEIKEVTAQKLQFFTNISHEVRTPLTLILAPLDRLVTLFQDSPYLPDLNLIQKNAGRLLRVINQILDFRKVEGKEEKLKVRKADLVSFAQEVKSYFDSMAVVRGIRYSFVSDMKAGDVWIDTDLMEKALVNLLSNAFKFTPEGGAITLSLSSGEDVFLIRVEDTGTGISPQNIPYLFNRFYTGNRSTGTGIGLHLVDEYVRMHGGTVSVESDPGKRTVFMIRLLKGKGHFTGDTLMELPLSPLAYDAANLDDAEVRETLTRTYPYTILVTEDDDEVRQFLSKELASNFTIVTARNGREALALLENEEVSLVLSDVMMPEMNGFELCRSIKTSLPFSHIPVILLTALSDERQRIYGVFGGADGYIQKPFRIDYIKVKIIRLLEERQRFRDRILQSLQDADLSVEGSAPAESLDDLFLRKFLECMEEAYPDPEFNVEKLSDTLGLSRGHLHRKIKELTGTTPVDFLRVFRLKKAVVLLRQRRYGMSEIAYQTGFSSPAYFSKCFKTVYGVTPSEY